MDYHIKDLPKNLKELNAFALRWKEEKTSLPVYAIVKPNFKDSSANELTKSVIWDFVNVRGGAAYRINNGAVYDAKRKAYRKGSVRKGVPDIIGVLDGRFFGIEIKYGRDKQSADQRTVELEIQSAGGTYFIAKTYEDYLNKINDVCKNWSKQ